MSNCELSANGTLKFEKQRIQWEKDFDLSNSELNERGIVTGGVTVINMKSVQ